MSETLQLCQIQGALDVTSSSSLSMSYTQVVSPVSSSTFSTPDISSFAPMPSSTPKMVSPAPNLTQTPEHGLEQVLPRAIDDDCVLHLYRTTLQQLFPFVLIPKSMTATQLRSTRPFLMLAIRTVIAASFPQPAPSDPQMRTIMEYVADRVFIRLEASMDLLLGIIIICGWCNGYQRPRPQLSLLIALAEFLIGQMDLHSHLQRDDHKDQLNTQSLNLYTIVQNERRRACLAVWYLMSW